MPQPGEDTLPGMHMIVEVGAQLDPDVSWPEGAALTMFAGEPVQLMIFLAHPHELEVQAVSQAPTRFAWVDCEDAGVLAYRLGPILSWSEVPYTPHRSGPEDGMPGVDADPRVRIVLVDRATNIVRALHTVRWPATSMPWPGCAAAIRPPRTWSSTAPKCTASPHPSPRSRYFDGERRGRLVGNRHAAW
jgi:hypothetical protein